jgi:hypothetical protein
VVRTQNAAHGQNRQKSADFEKGNSVLSARPPTQTLQGQALPLPFRFFLELFTFQAVVMSSSLVL